MRRQVPSVRGCTLIAVAVLIVAAGAGASADLTLIGTTTHELREDTAAETQTPPAIEVPEDDEAAEETLPQTIARVGEELPWSKTWIVEARWRIDLFEADPRIGVDPVYSTIRLEELGRTILLDWEERVAEISDDAAVAAWEEQMGEREEEAEAGFAQGQAEIIAQITPEALEQLPPEMREQVLQRIRELQEQQEPDQEARQDPVEPTVTVEIEGPLGGETLLGLACTKYAVISEIRFPDDFEAGRHVREETHVLLTEQLPLPAIEENPWEWRGTVTMTGRPDVWEDATEGMDVPEGFAMKTHTVIKDLTAGTVTVVDGQIVEYDEAEIAPDVFEVPAGFTVEQMHLHEIGAEDAGEVQP